MRWRLVSMAALFAFAACEQPARSLMTSPSAHSLRAERVDQHFLLSNADREKIIPGYDRDALERLLAWIVPEHRHDILSMFQIPEDTTKPRGMIMGFTDPELQRLLDEVWAPMWDHVGASDTDIAANTYRYPGREIAAQRRLARRIAPVDPH